MKAKQNKQETKTACKLYNAFLPLSRNNEGSFF